MFLIYSEDDSENGQCSYGSLVQQCLIWTASLYEQFHKVVFKQKIGMGHFGSQYECSQAVYSYTSRVTFQYLTTPLQYELFSCHFCVI